MSGRRNGEAYTVLYAAVICVICSVALAVATAALRPRQERMAELDRRYNILKAFGVPLADDQGRPLPSDRVEELYRQHVRERRVDPRTGAELDTVGGSVAASGGETLPLFEWVEEGRVTRYAIPISGKGLWSTIYGYLALDGNLEHIIGVTFYKHGETPGLGGEIETDWFQGQFRGRRIWSPERGLLPIVVAKGRAAPAEREAADRVVVDGISGATMTGRGVMEFMNADLSRYEAFIRRVREGR